jgi:hypothetical protein
VGQSGVLDAEYMTVAMGTIQSHTLLKRGGRINAHWRRRSGGCVCVCVCVFLCVCVCGGEGV